MKKISFAYFIYIFIVFSYFLFLYPLETMGETRYAAIGHATYFTKLPLVFIYLVMIVKGNWFDRWWRTLPIKNYFCALSALALIFLTGLRLIELPFDLFWFYVRRSAGTSKESFISWISNQGLDFLFYWLGLVVLFILFQALTKRFRHTWPVVLWGCLIPLVILVVFVQPLWIDPLYYDFYPLPEGELRTDIEAIAETLEIKDLNLLQVEMSERVTTYNAYVNGIFGSTQVVFWDTMLNDMEHGEVMFIFAHELGHYVHNHVFWGMMGYIVFSLLLFLVLGYLLHLILKTKFKHLALTHVTVLPLVLLIGLSLYTVTEPITLAVSREIEREADKFAIELTEESDLVVAKQSFERMAINSKSDIDPVFWVKWLRYSHPPLQERIDLVHDYLAAQ